MKRECGSCTLCCTITRVPELEKPEYETCKFCELSKGCSIYKDRPKSCQDFKCAWLKGDMPDTMKPNEAHVMIERWPNIPVVLALPEKGHKDTWRTPSTIDMLTKEYQDKGISVLASDGMALLAKGHTVESVREDIMKVVKNLKVV